MASKNLQHDSFGYNIVSSFLSYVYDAIINEKIVLWDSPQKQSRINADNLINIDHSNQVDFRDALYFYIFETWSSSRQESSFSITGFSFSNISRKGHEVNYGFIDYNEIVELLKINKVKTNPNAFYLSTFYHVFMNKSYNYDLIFFDDRPIINRNSRKPEKDFAKGVKIKNKAFGAGTSNLNYIEVIPSKLITYRLKAFNYDLKSEIIIDALEKYFDKNRSLWKIFGSDQLNTSFKEAKLIITSVEITKLVSIQKDQTVFKLVRIQPFALEKPFLPIDLLALDSLDIRTADMRNIMHAINKIDFEYEIIEINENPVNPKFTREYMNALLQRNYRNIIPGGSTD